MKMIRVFLLKDVEKIGIAGEVIKASQGYARNYLIPNKLGLEVTPENEKSLAHRVKVIVNKKEAVESKTSMLAERIKSSQIVLRKKLHDNDQLYGSINAREVTDALSKQHNITVGNNQVVINKAIKSKGVHEVTIKLSSKLQPKLSVKILGEAA